MELVAEGSEEKLIDLLAIIERQPGGWINVHINMNRISEQMLEGETLSSQVLRKIRLSSARVAEMLEARLKGFEGKILVFEDSDVVALFKKDGSACTEVLEKLRREFSHTGLADLLTISDMQQRMASLIQLSKDKQKTAETFRHRRQAVDAAEAIFAWTVPDMGLMKRIREKRQSHSRGVMLIIEDDVVARGMLAMALRDQYEVVQAKDAKSGITAYIDKAPHVVFLDIHLPDHNGHEVLNRLKLIDAEACVLMISSDTIPENVIQAKKAGVAGFVKKPFTRENLMKYITLCKTLPKHAA